MDDWKSPDVSAAGMISRNHQKEPSLSQMNETENLNKFFNASESPIIKLEIEAKQDNEEPMDEVFMEQNEDLVNIKTHSVEDNPLPISDEPKVQEMVGVQKRKSEKNFKCDFCQITSLGFTTEKNLSRHIEEVHEGIRNYKCNLCDKAFYRKWDLNQHIKSCQIYYICETCSQTFCYKNALIQHEKKHNKRYKKFSQRRFNPSKCEYCLKVFQNTLKLHGHIWKVHQCATKHDCFLCKKSFQSFDDLNEHTKNCDDRWYQKIFTNV